MVLMNTVRTAMAFFCAFQLYCCSEQRQTSGDGGTYSLYRVSLDFKQLLETATYVVYGSTVGVRNVPFAELTSQEAGDIGEIDCDRFSIATIESRAVVVRRINGEAVTPSWGGELFDYSMDCLSQPGFQGIPQDFYQFPSAIYFGYNFPDINRPFLSRMLMVRDSIVLVPAGLTQCGIPLEIDVGMLMSAISINDFTGILANDTYPCNPGSEAEKDGSDGSDGK